MPFDGHEQYQPETDPDVAKIAEIERALGPNGEFWVQDAWDMGRNRCLGQILFDLKASRRLWGALENRVLKKQPVPAFNDRAESFAEIKAALAKLRLLLLRTSRDFDFGEPQSPLRPWASNALLAKFEEPQFVVYTLSPAHVFGSTANAVSG